MSLFDRHSDLPGLKGVTRECTPRGKGLKKLSAGDIAVVDAPDIGRAFAQRLIQSHPAAVVNVAAFTTGQVPNYGPQMLIDAGIMLVDNVGADVWRSLKDGRKARLTDEGDLFYGTTHIARGRVLDAAMLERAFAGARQSLTDRMEAFFGNTTQFIHSEAPLLIDGLGVPETRVPIVGRKVLVVSPGPDHAEQLKKLKPFIKEAEPVLIGCDEGADSLVAAGYTPDIIVGDPSGIDTGALKSGAVVILPADPDGVAVGLERIQDLGIGAMTFPAATRSATDLALLLADFHGAGLIVNCGAGLDLDEVFAGRPQATPSALLTRSKVGQRLVDADAMVQMYTMRTPHSFVWLFSLIGLVVLAATVVAIAGLAGDGAFVDNLGQTFATIAQMARELVGQ
ncbi:putative cytokinetic ring protein SteA [Corynebacterium mendelii]|uniref:Thiamine pyrophosphokinase n=1 Tax=Corynebacterium mendelii TaxID=2765362 RepID=A0A939DYI5_9CORY|nr:putative cytokinetic ring protein SteA [Corynebacterium mendelii]MBN9643585.1 thiamine pyrophosphokinase [Corynebacterium mendelii]